MISFASDYLEGAHPLILQKLLEANPEQFPGYGEDRICAAARDRLREAAELPDAEIYFLSGGTQANRVVISALLRPKVGFSLWEAADETHSVVRFATSWATKEQSLEKLREIL